MGRHFGNLSDRVHGTVTFTVSPMEMRVFAGFFTKSVPNFMRRVGSQFFIVVPPFVGAYLLYDWGEKRSLQLSRKNPKDFEDEH